MKSRYLTIVTMATLSISLSGAAGAAEFVVTNAESIGEGSFYDIYRETEASAGSDTITFDAEFFDVPRTITLPLQIYVTENLSIEGPGSDLLTLELIEIAFQDWFYISGTPSNRPTFTIEGVTISSLSNDAQKRMIFAPDANIFMRDVRMFSNGNHLIQGSGSAIATYNGDLVIQDSSIEGFTSHFRGGAVFARYQDGGHILIERSAFRGNQVVSDTGATGFPKDGGALFVESGPVPSLTPRLEIISSEFSDNRTPSGSGAAISFHGPVSTSIANSTLSNNTANGGYGGAVYGLNTSSVVSLSMYVDTSTMVDNTASQHGGAIATRGNARLGLRVTNSVIARNASTNRPAAQDVYSTDVVASHSLIGDEPGDNDETIITEHTSATGSLILNEDPMLGSLAFNGGDTRTNAVRSGSPLIDAGREGVAPHDGSPETFSNDQRGTGFERVSGAQIDIGAYEFVASGGGDGGSGSGGGGGGGGSTTPLEWLLLAGLAAVVRRRGQCGQD